MHSVHTCNLIVRSQQPVDTRVIAIESCWRNRFRFRRCLMWNDFRLFPIVDSSRRETRRKSRDGWAIVAMVVRLGRYKRLVSCQRDPTRIYIRIYLELRATSFVAFCLFARSISSRRCFRMKLALCVTIRDEMKGTFSTHLLSFINKLIWQYLKHLVHVELVLQGLCRVEIKQGAKNETNAFFA